MNDGLTHYLHFLCPLQEGWVAVQELKKGEKLGGTFVVPVAPDCSFFPVYHVDYIKHSLDVVPVSHVAKAKRTGEKFEFEIASYNLEFEKVKYGRPREYVGKVMHSDFLFELIEVDFPPGLLDTMFDETGYLIVGCSPFRYKIEIDA